MICNKCGANNPGRSRFCQSCGSPLPDMGAQQVPAGAGMYGSQGMQRRIHTMFSDLMEGRRTLGATVRLIVFIVSCVSVFLNILALAVRESSRADEVQIATFLWVVLLICQILFTILLVFRLDLANVIVGCVGVEGICIPFFYVLMGSLIDDLNGSSGVILGFMVLLSLGSFVKFLFVMLHTFMRRVDFSYINYVISICYACAAVLFSTIAFIMLMSCGESHVRKYIHKELFRYFGLGFGFVTYLLALLCIGAISICLYRGILGTKTKFRSQLPYDGRYGGQAAVSTAGPAYAPPVQEPAGGSGLRCIAGSYAGQTIPFQGEIILGSEQGTVSVVISDAKVSRQHCRIRYEAAQNCYYVMDLSTNGTYVNNQRIQRGEYIACTRGSVIALSHQGQQYQLL